MARLKVTEWEVLGPTHFGDGFKEQWEIEVSSVISKSLVSATMYIVLFLNETGNSEGRDHPSEGRGHDH